MLLERLGATENAILAGTLARGVTRIWNPHIRPEVLDLIVLLTNMNAKIRVFGQEHTEVTGVDDLSGTEHRGDGREYGADHLAGRDGHYAG